MFAFHHVALSVKDLVASVAFYECFGFKTLLEWQAEDGSLRITHLKLGDAVLELFCFAEPQPAPASTAQLGSDLQRIGVKHFGLQVKGIRQARERLEALGIACEMPVTRGRTGIDYFFVKDPDGIFVEVVQDER